MLSSRFAASLFTAGMVVLGAGVAWGQNYPYKPVRIITSGIGGGNDFTARLVAQGISGPLGQQVIVENQASGVIPGELVAKAQPDGYTLLVAGGTHWIGPLIQDTPYDPVRDFSPIAIAEKAPLILAVHPSVAANSVKELIAVARARPGALNYLSLATGSTSHLAAELFKSMAGLNIVRVPYKSMGNALSDLIGGQQQLMFVSAPPVAPHVKSGRLKALAVTSIEPSALAPGVPTVAATGLPGFEVVSLGAILAPAKTPKPVIARLNQEIVRFLKMPDAKDRFFNAGSEVVASTPEQLAAAIAADMARLGKVIKEVGIRAE